MYKILYTLSRVIPRLSGDQAKEITMAVIAYIRVSSNKQTLEHQRYEIEQFSQREKLRVHRWVEETISSRKALKNRKLGKLLDELKKGDVLLACEISRFGRSLLEIMRILEICLSRDCKVWTIKENYRLGNDIQSKVLAFAFGLAAEIERNLISQRTKSSLANIRANGRKLGRPLAAQSRRLKLHNNVRKIRNMMGIGASKAKIARTLNVSRSTLRRFLQRQTEQEEIAAQMAVSGDLNAGNDASMSSPT